ncbi:MAG: zf-TFIIB domain-containing protein [Halieaceae bacterium]
MDCPKCSAVMETKLYGPKISLDRCTECYGLFVAPDVLTEMRSEWMVEAFLDIGHPKVGKEFNDIDDIDCPECQVPMDKISDPVQTHIWMESCPQCGKIFLDAGEFSDLKYETFMDRVKNLLQRRRPAS